LLDEQDCTVAVVEVIVTHAPEQTVLDYYKNNHIAVVSYKLQSDEDVNRLDAATLTPDSVDVCWNRWSATSTCIYIDSSLQINKTL